MFNGAFTEALLLGLAALLVVAAVIDVRTFTISNRLNLTVALLAPLYWLSIALSPWPGVAIQLAAGVTVFTILAGAFYAGMMGGGDVKLAAALALWCSPASWPRICSPGLERSKLPPRRWSPSGPRCLSPTGRCRPARSSRPTASPISLGPRS